VLMPEATAHFNNLSESREHEIGLTRKFRYVEAVAKAHRVNNSADDKLWGSVLIPNAPHILRAAIGRKSVGHTARSSGKSLISFKRFPSTIIFTRLAESSEPNSVTA
jgi:hypothetical protein